MSDVTPHESVPFAEAAHRQYFRLVTSSVSVWYAKHSTANPLGCQPDPSITRSRIRRTKGFEASKSGVCLQLSGD